MIWLYLLVVVFSALTLYFVYEEHRKTRFPEKTFAAVCVLEAAVIIISAALLIKSL